METKIKQFHTSITHDNGVVRDVQSFILEVISYNGATEKIAYIPTSIILN